MSRPGQRGPPTDGGSRVPIDTAKMPVSLAYPAPMYLSNRARHVVLENPDPAEQVITYMGAPATIAASALQRRDYPSKLGSGFLTMQEAPDAQGYLASAAGRAATRSTTHLSLAPDGGVAGARGNPDTWGDGVHMTIGEGDVDLHPVAGLHPHLPTASHNRARQQIGVANAIDLATGGPPASAAHIVPGYLKHTRASESSAAATGGGGGGGGGIVGVAANQAAASRRALRDTASLLRAAPYESDEPATSPSVSRYASGAAGASGAGGGAGIGSVRRVAWADRSNQDAGVGVSAASRRARSASPSARGRFRASVSAQQQERDEQLASLGGGFARDEREKGAYFADRPAASRAQYDVDIGLSISAASSREARAVGAAARGGGGGGGGGDDGVDGDHGGGGSGSDGMSRSATAKRSAAQRGGSIADRGMGGGGGWGGGGGGGGHRSATASGTFRTFDKGGQSRRAKEQALVPLGSSTVDVHSQITAHNVDSVLGGITDQLDRAERDRGSLQIERDSLRELVRSLRMQLKETAQQAEIACSALSKDLKHASDALVKSREELAGATDEADGLRQDVAHLEKEIEQRAVEEARMQRQIASGIASYTGSNGASNGGGGGGGGGGGTFPVAGQARQPLAMRGPGGVGGAQLAAMGPGAAWAGGAGGGGAGGAPLLSGYQTGVGPGSALQARVNSADGMFPSKSPYSAANLAFSGQSPIDQMTIADGASSAVGYGGEETLRALVHQLHAQVFDRDAEITRLLHSLRQRDREVSILRDQLAQLNVLVYSHITRERGARLLGVMDQSRRDRLEAATRIAGGVGGGGGGGSNVGVGEAPGLRVATDPAASTAYSAQQIQRQPGPPTALAPAALQAGAGAGEGGRTSRPSVAAPRALSAYPERMGRQ